MNGFIPCIGPIQKDSHPKPGNDRALTSSRTHIWSPLVITREQRRARSNKLPRRNVSATCAHSMGQDYPFTGPSPGANPSIYPKGHVFFSFFSFCRKKRVNTLGKKINFGGKKTRTKYVWGVWCTTEVIALRAL